MLLVDLLIIRERFESTVRSRDFHVIDDSVRQSFLVFRLLVLELEQSYYILREVQAVVCWWGIVIYCRIYVMNAVDVPR